MTSSKMAFPGFCDRLASGGQGARVQGYEKAFEPARFDTGFTLVEVLVAISVIGVLMALLLTAVQAARETARRTQCQHHLKQLGLAMEHHVSTYWRYPSNGWGYLWIGDPDRGTGREQPGGWIYNILPFIERSDLRDLGKGKDAAQKQEALTQLQQVSIPVLTCPTRAGSGRGPANPDLVPRNANQASQVGKTDYAVNEGDYITDTREGPASLEEGDSNEYPWRDTTFATGICYQRSEVSPAMILDGLSQTYLIGEKYVSKRGYGTYEDPGYDQSMYCGVDLDINRWVLAPPLQDGDGIEERCFGSAHTAGCSFVFCDGSVRMISYYIDAEVHRRLGNRKDGKPVDASLY